MNETSKYKNLSSLLERNEQSNIIDRINISKEALISKLERGAIDIDTYDIKLSYVQKEVKNAVRKYCHEMGLTFGRFNFGPFIPSNQIRRMTPREVRFYKTYGYFPTVITKIVKCKSYYFGKNANREDTIDE